MALESATYISQLVATNPVVGDPVGQGDDHLRLLKTVLQAQFPNFTAAVLNSTQAQLDAVIATALGVSGQFQVPLGAVGAPSYSFTGDLNTGLWSAGADQLEAACGGVTILSLGTSGGTLSGQLNVTGILNAQAALNVTGTATFTVPLAAANLASNSVTTAKILDANVTLAKIANSSGSNKLLGSVTGGAAYQEINLGAFLASSAGTLNLATDASHRAYVIGYDKSSGAPTAVPSAGYVVHVREEQASGTNGQSATLTAGSWSKRVLNVTKTDEVGTSLASSVLTLPAGTYEVSGSCQGYVDTGVSSGGGFKSRLRDTTNNVTLIVGSNDTTANVFHGSGATSQAVTLKSEVRGRFTLSGSANVEYQHYPVTTALATGGSALTTGEVEVYAELFFRLVKI